MKPNAQIYRKQLTTQPISQPKANTQKVCKLGALCKTKPSRHNKTKPSTSRASSKETNTLAQHLKAKNPTCAQSTHHIPAIRLNIRINYLTVNLQQATQQNYEYYPPTHVIYKPKHPQCNTIPSRLIKSTKEKPSQAQQHSLHKYINNITHTTFQPSIKLIQLQYNPHQYNYTVVHNHTKLKHWHRAFSMQLTAPGFPSHTTTSSPTTEESSTQPFRWNRSAMKNLQSQQNNPAPTAIYTTNIDRKLSKLIESKTLHRNASQVPTNHSYQHNAQPKSHKRQNSVVPLKCVAYNHPQAYANTQEKLNLSISDTNKSNYTNVNPKQRTSASTEREIRKARHNPTTNQKETNSQPNQKTSHPRYLQHHQQYRRHNSHCSRTLHNPISTNHIMHNKHYTPPTTSTKSYCNQAPNHSKAHQHPKVNKQTLQNCGKLGTQTTTQTQSHTASTNGRPKNSETLNYRLTTHAHNHYRLQKQIRQKYSQTQTSTTLKPQCLTQIPTKQAIPQNHTPSTTIHPRQNPQPKTMLTTPSTTTITQSKHAQTKPHHPGNLIVANSTYTIKPANRTQLAVDSETPQNQLNHIAREPLPYQPSTLHQSKFIPKSKITPVDIYSETLIMSHKLQPRRQSQQTHKTVNPAQTLTIREMNRSQITESQHTTHLNHYNARNQPHICQSHIAANLRTGQSQLTLQFHTQTANHKPKIGEPLQSSNLHIKYAKSAFHKTNTHKAQNSKTNSAQQDAQQNHISRTEPVLKEGGPTQQSKSGKPLTRQPQNNVSEVQVSDNWQVYNHKSIASSHAVAPQVANSAQENPNHLLQQTINTQCRSYPSNNQKKEMKYPHYPMSSQPEHQIQADPTTHPKHKSQVYTTTNPRRTTALRIHQTQVREITSAIHKTHSQVNQFGGKYRNTTKSSSRPIQSYHILQRHQQNPQDNHMLYIPNNTSNNYATHHATNKHQYLSNRSLSMHNCQPANFPHNINTNLPAHNKKHIHPNCKLSPPTSITKITRTIAPTTNCLIGSYRIHTNAHKCLETIMLQQCPQQTQCTPQLTISNIIPLNTKSCTKDSTKSLVQPYGNHYHKLTNTHATTMQTTYNNQPN
eukprot:gene2884-1866_t